ncbi:MAG: insulinase family protein [Planctomycetales bacterium]|nr:insulinase family protein [Planctomycetales bacterium]
MHTRIASFAIICLLPLIAAAELPQVASVEGVTQYELKNGAKVLLMPDPSSSSVTVNMTVLVGSRHEGYGEAGMAHLLEHMLFKGTPQHPDIPKVLQDRGASFNGTTWLDRTNYYETLSADEDHENLEFALSLEADRLVNSFIKAEDLASEFSVVRNEFERGENSPQRVLMQRMQAATYEWHNYGRSTIGNRSDIERVPIVNLREFYRKHYRVDNIVVIVTGKFKTDAALKLIEKHFGALDKPSGQLDKTYTIEPAQDGERTVVVRRVGDVQLVGACYHVPAVSHEDFPAADIIANILGTEPAGRMYKQLVETKKATGVYAMSYDTHDPGLLWVLAEAPQSMDIEELRRSLLSLVEQIGEEGVTDAELARAKQEIGENFEKEAANAARMASSLSEWAARGDWRMRYLHRDRIAKVTLEDVQRVAKNYLVRNNRTVGLFIPTDGPQRAAIPESPNLSAELAAYKGREAVEAGEAFDPSFENIKQRTARTNLSPGVKVAMLPKKSRGSRVRLSLAVRYGDGDSLKGLETATDLLPTLMTQGTKQLSFEQLQDELTKYSAVIHGSGDAGEASFTVETKREHLVPVLELLRQVLREPALGEKEFEVLRSQQITQLEASKTDPNSLASNRIRRAMSAHPKGHVLYLPTIEEQLERWKSVKLEQVERLHREFLSASHIELAVVGDFDPDEIHEPLASAFTNWVSDKPYARIPNPAPQGVEGRIEKINTPDKANAIYLASMRFPMNDRHEDYEALVIGNYILGGGSLSSRLGNRVRQQEGLSYGVGSIFRASAEDENAQFAIQAIMNPTKTDQLTKVIREELDKLLKDGIDAEELDRAKQGYLNSRLLSRSQDSGLLGMLSSYVHLDRDTSDSKEHEEKVAKLTVEQVNNALKKHINPAKLVIVLGGDFAAAAAAAEN